ncbi:MAG: hypothetical protein MZV70_33020 [Desulfobacterales bacterium]|nr:hypothetical protein [Desulfobacterales bacterium]
MALASCRDHRQRLCMHLYANGFSFSELPRGELTGAPRELDGRQDPSFRGAPSGRGLPVVSRLCGNGVLFLQDGTKTGHRVHGGACPCRYSCIHRQGSP